MLFHLVLDVSHLSRLGFRHKRAYSIIEYWIRSRRMKPHGVHPRIVCNEALELMYVNKNRENPLHKS